jgi:hypothetical protein
MQNESAYGAGNTTKSLVGSAGRPLINGKGDIFANFKTFSKAIAFNQRILLGAKVMRARNCARR